ncbi:MAG: phosphatidylserine/phosphatidylglycerophosphate/cardiolipin synthase family protein [Gemmatimonadota bacterium]|jgi:cardiolipin synthase
MEPDSRRLLLLVDSEDFWRALRADIAGARDRIWAQTLSFEGDTAGKGLARAVEESRAPDRRILVDRFTRWVQNDRFLFSPTALADEELQAEVEETDRMIRSLVQAGVAIRWGSPIGLFGRRAAWRNHRKLVLIDGSICYLGGINFTDHNFQWHDLMLRVEDRDVSAFCSRGFERSWQGLRCSEQAQFEGIEVLNIDPPDLTPYQRIWSAISEVRNEIFVESAYLTLPLSDSLANAARRGVKVRILSPDENNVRLFRRYITWEAERNQFDLRFLPGMTHMKAVLLDRHVLIIGSSNLHFTGHRTQNETMALVTDPGLVRDFIDRVAEPDWARSKPSVGSESRSGKTLRLGMKAYMCVADLSGRGRPCAPRDAGSTLPAQARKGRSRRRTDRMSVR